MAVTSAIIDKSVFQRLCQTNNSPLWNELSNRYQLVLPLVLVEEVLVNILDPGSKPMLEAAEMQLQLQRLQPCWLEDIHEIAFREFVLGEKLATLPPPSDEFLKKLFSLKSDDSELQVWLGERRKLKRETVAQWKDAQQKMQPANGPVQIPDECAFLREVVYPSFFIRILDNPENKEIFLRAVFKKTFQRNPDHSNGIAAAIQNYGRQNFAKFHITFICLIVRLYYFLGPTVQTASGRKIIKSGNQINNVEDSFYVAASLLGDRLITGDEEMARVANAFRDVGLWKGTVIFIDPNRKLEDLIPAILV
jgi:hypothetical protein